jgi:hypothetical protein
LTIQPDYLFLFSPRFDYTEKQKKPATPVRGGQSFYGNPRSVFEGGTV